MTNYKVKNFEIVVENGIVTHIVKGQGNSRTSANAYKYSKQVGAYIVQHGVKFTTLKSGIYKGVYAIY